MADKIPLKAIFDDETGDDVVALGEFGTGDTIPVDQGGTGATTASGARTNLGITSANISYSNATSGLTATDVQAAIDEVSQGSGDASNISYSNTSSGLAATDVQAAIDEIDTTLDGLSFDAGSISYSNTSSGLAATDVQAAIDEIESRAVQDTSGNILLIKDSTGTVVWGN